MNLRIYKYDYNSAVFTNVELKLGVDESHPYNTQSECYVIKTLPWTVGVSSVAQQNILWTTGWNKNKKRQKVIIIVYLLFIY